MNKWYKIEDLEVCDTRLLLVECRDGRFYERYVINNNGDSWQPEGELVFWAGRSIERFEIFKKQYPQKVTEVTEEEVFTIIL